MYQIMLVDDEPNILAALRRVLSARQRFEMADMQCHISAFTEPELALQYAEAHELDLVISDYRMPGLDGVQLLTALRVIQPQAIRIILSGYADLKTLIAAINDAHIYRFLSKPWSDYDLKMVVAQALRFRQIVLENERLQEKVRRDEAKLQCLEQELRRLEQASPGITQLRWGNNGDVVFSAQL